MYESKQEVTKVVSLLKDGGQSGISSRLKLNVRNTKKILIAEVKNADLHQHVHLVIQTV